jgi:hypothetical protein
MTTHTFSSQNRHAVLRERGWSFAHWFVWIAFATMLLVLVCRLADVVRIEWNKAHREAVQGR